MRRAWKVLAGLVLLAIAAAVAGVAILVNTDFNEYKGLLAEQVEGATGRTLAIDGDLRLDISLNPVLAVERVRFANAAWGSRPDMVTLERLEAEVELLPLLSGDIRIKRLILAGLDALLETDAKGTGNWEIAATAAGPAEDKGGAVRLPVVHQVLLVDLSVTYRDGASGESRKIELEVLEAKADRMDSPLALTLRGQYTGAAFAADGKFGTLRRLIDGDPLAVALQAEAFGITAGLDGRVAKPRELAGLDVAVTVKGDSLAETWTALQGVLPALKDIAPPALGPYSATARIEGSAAAMSASAVKVSVGRAGTALVSAEGVVGDLIGGGKVDLEVALKVADMAALARALQTELPALKPLEISARVSDASGAYVADGLELRVGGSNLGGRIAVSMAGPRPHIDARLTSDALDLADVLPVAKGQEQAPAEIPAADGQARVFSGDPLPLDGLAIADAKVGVRVKHLRAGGLALAEVVLDLVLADGRLEVTSFEALVADGKLSATAMVDAGGGRSAMSVKARARGIDLGRLLQETQVTDMISTRVDADVDLAGSGGSVRAIMAGLGGRTQIVGRGGHINSDALGVFATGLFDALPWAGKEDANTINCIISRIDFTKGLARSRALLIDTNGVIVRGRGTVHLGTESIDMVLAPKAKSVSLASFVAPVSIGGTLASPTFIPDVGGLAEGVVVGTVETVGTLLAQPVDLLGSLIIGKEKTSAKDPCVAALGGAPGPGTSPPPPPAPTPTEPAASPPPAPAAKEPAAPPPETKAKGEGGLDKFLWGLGKSIDKAIGAKPKN